MDVVDDAEGPLDPRIQIELENLNTATDNINKLEIELDEAHTAFGQLLSESTRRLKDISNKLGTNCIERARCYYEALEVARQARVQCQYQAQLFQRASEIHAAAKELVAVAEARFVSHQHEWNFDQAWQDMLNHATIKVMDAENQKAECGREHHRRATLFHDAEMKVQQLEEKYRRSIIKAQPYFEIRAQYDQMLATQKECVERLQKAVKEAKRSYSSSFRALEDISNQIHEQRRDYDMVANGPREPGVGAELVSPEDSLNYETELNKVSTSRLNSLASSTEPDTEDRSRDFEDVRDLKQRVDDLGGRSIDGSESFSSQWELELQASMEKLNNLSMKNSDWNNSKVKDESDSAKNCTASVNEIMGNVESDTQRTIPESPKTEQKIKTKLPMDFQILRKLSSNSPATTSSLDVRQTLTQSPINMILNKSKLAIKNGISKSLSNSPVNMSSFGFGRTKVENQSRTNDQTPMTENSEDAISVAGPSAENADLCSEEKLNESRIVDTETGSPSPMVTKNHENIVFEKDNNCKVSQNSGDCSESEFPKLAEESKNNRTKHDNAKPQKLMGFASRSVDSTPVRSKNQLAKISGKSVDHGKENFVKGQSLKNGSSAITSSVRELPLLSLFENSTNGSISKDRSCSMINLAEKHNLKTLLDNPDLRNIQMVSVERLASARNNIMVEHSEANKNSNV